MVTHRGQLVEDAVRKSGFSLTVVAKRLDISRRTLYQWFTYPDLSSRKILKIGKVIGQDFSDQLSDLGNIASEFEYSYGSSETLDYKKVLTERDKYLSLYHDLVEKHSKTMEKMMQLQEEINELKLKLNQQK